MLPMIKAAAGLILLLVGMQKMKEGLEKLSQRQIRSLITTFSANPLLAALTGTVATIIAQSSTAISVLTIGFVNAGLMNLTQAIGILLGANVGTCLTVQLFSFDFFRLALPATITGALISILFRHLPARNLGLVLLGFGAIFWGLQVMSESLAPLRSTHWFNEAVSSVKEDTFKAVLAGTAVSALLHSSAAATGIVMLLSTQQVFSLSTAIALVLGNNIGTCFTALLASIGSSSTGKRVALAHLLLNVAGTALFLPVLPGFTTLIASITDSFPNQVACAHTIFNVTCSVIALPLVRPYAVLLEKLVPEKRA